jgi:GxxExxY protein
LRELDALSNRVIGLAIDVHRAIGPGLLETVYQECMCMELADAGIPFRSQAMVPVHYKGRLIPLGFRSDIVVADAIILEIKAVAAIVPAHEAQILTYLRMSGIRLGFLMNFHAPKLKDGLKRFIV